MEYAPIKNILRRFIRGNAALTKLFFGIIGVLFLRARYVKRELRQLMNDERRCGKILDAGFGYGQYSYWMMRQYSKIELTSVEIEPVMIDDFRKFLHKRGMNDAGLKELDLTRMIYENQFELALSVDVMEHIDDDEKVFANIYRALKTGGVFLMHTPHIRAAAKQGKGAFVGEHFRDGYRTIELRDKLKRAGFKRIEYTLTYGTYGSLAWNLLQKYPLSVLNKVKILFPLLPVYLLVVYPAAEVLMRWDMKCANREGDGIMVKGWKE